jgi:4-amino-4-deoxy-L-arabinose transferase-like glycosyltransferase
MKNHTRNLLIAAFGILLLLIALAFLVMNICHNESYDAINNAAYFYATSIYILASYQFIFAAFNIKLRFDLLNNALV